MTTRPPAKPNAKSAAKPSKRISTAHATPKPAETSSSRNATAHSTAKHAATSSNRISSAHSTAKHAAARLAAAAAPAAPAPSRAASSAPERQRRADRIAKILDEHFPAPPVPLEHSSPFQLLVAVILSAQCTDARVNLVTPALFARAPDAQAMSAMTADDILPFIRTCGLAPGKAKALATMSRILVEEHDGAVPDDLEALERLPGVGHKTASVVMVQAFGRAAFPVDTHIHRLAGRWQLSRARNVVEVERDLKALFAEDRWHLLHLQLIYFGRASCPAKGHVPETCPICSWAMSAARARDEQRQGVSKPVRPRPNKPSRTRR